MITEEKLNEIEKATFNYDLYAGSITFLRLLIAEVRLTHKICHAADKLTDNIAEFGKITDSIYLENLDTALENWKGKNLEVR